MKSGVSRRGFLATLPVLTAPAFAETKPVKIEAVEVWEYRGHRQAVRGIDAQYQVNPLHIYDELRPAAYKDNPNPGAPQSTAISAYYVRIKADNAEGLYGPIEKEAAIVVDEQLRPFLIGKDALAQEKLWDQMYRSNRHARRGHFLWRSAQSITRSGTCAAAISKLRYTGCLAAPHARRWKPTQAVSASLLSRTRLANAPFSSNRKASAFRNGSSLMARATVTTGSRRMSSWFACSAKRWARKPSSCSMYTAAGTCPTRSNGRTG